MLGKSLFFLAFVFFTPSKVSSNSFDETYGIGTVHINPYNYFLLTFYNKPGDKKAFDQMVFSVKKGDDNLHFQFASGDLDSLPGWFMPEYFNTSPEKNRLEFRCLALSGDSAKVIVHNQKGISRWIQLGVDVKYRTWSEFYSSVASVEIVEGNPYLYSKASLKSKYIPIVSKEQAGPLQVIRSQKVEGEWMLVEVTTLNENYKEINKVTGWIRWHDEEKPLISYNLSLD